MRSCASSPPARWPTKLRAKLCNRRLADDDTLLAVDEALTKLAKEDSDAAEFIKLRFFAGFTTDEAAQVFGIHERTARRHWRFARGWLYQELRGDSSE